MKEDESILGLKIGDRIQARYEIRNLLGMGGFAAVFLAYDTEIEREVAIKVLNVTSLLARGSERDVMLERFKREAKLAAQITHPCVVQIFDYGVLEDQGDPFIIMEMLEGHDLEDEIQETGGLDPARVIPLFVDCLEALGDAHEMGIVHKDLKPSNLFLTDPGSRREMLKIVDFGIAHPGDGEGEGENGGKRLTKTGLMLGTFEYLSPEYIEEQIITPALDVYQMGLILVEVFVGSAVVSETTPWKCTMAHVRRELEVPSALWQSPLGPVIDRALAFEPGDRFATAGEFADALADIDPDEVPVLGDDVEWRRLDAAGDGVKTPDQETRSLIEEVETEKKRASEEMGAAGAMPGFSADNGSSEEGNREHDRLRESTPSMAAPSMQSPQDNLRIWGVVVVLLVVIGVGAYVATGSEDGPEESADPEPTELAEIEPGEPQAVDDPEQGPGDDDAAEETIEDEEEPEVVEVAIETNPAGGDVEIDPTFEGDDGQLVFGKGDEETTEVSVTKEGFEARTVEIGPGDGPVVAVELDEISQPDDSSDDAPSPEPRPEPEPTAPEHVEEQVEAPGDVDESSVQEDAPAASEGDESAEEEDDDDDDDGGGFIMAP